MSTKKIIWTSSLVLTCLTSSVFALGNYYIGFTTAASINPFKSYHLVAHPTSSTMHPQRFNSVGGATSALDLGASAGKNLTFNDKWSAQLGFGVYYSGTQHLGGEYGMKRTGAYNYHYTYGVNNQRYMFESELFYQVAQHMHVIFGFGAGVAHIDTSSVSYTDNGEPIPYPMASESTAQTHTAFSANAGIDYAASSHWHAQAMFKQIYLGQAKIRVDSGNGTLINLDQGEYKPWQIGLKVYYTFG